jgi:hypothetical protein
MEQQIQQLVNQVQILTKEAERAQAAQRELELQRMQDMQRNFDLQAQVIALATAASCRTSRVTFVDTKGIGKPAMFSSEPRQFPTRSFKLGNFLKGISKGMKDGLQWAADQDSLIVDVKPLESILEQGTDVKHAGRQTYAVLAQLCDGEALDLIQNVLGSDGWEAYRFLSWRFDPEGAGRRRNIMSQLLQPGSFDPMDLNSAIARWEEKVRIYERRSGAKLPDDIRSSILTETTKGPLKEHLIVNAAKLKSHDAVREERQCYLENRQNAEPTAMDVDAFTKGGKGGNGSGKGNKGSDKDVCKNCCKTGHWARDCCRPGGCAAKTKAHDKGRTKGGKGSGKGTFDGNCKHCGKYGHKADACWSNPANKDNADKGKVKGKKGKNMYLLEWQPPAADDDKTLEGLDFGAMFLDLRAGYRERNENYEYDEDAWCEEIKATVDSGSAVCAFPKNLCTESLNPCEASRSGVHLETASGQRVPREGMRAIECITESDLIRRLTGAATDVKKVLLAVSRLTETGHYVHFTSSGGYIKNKKDGCRIPMHSKNGVYVIRLWVRVTGLAWASRSELAALSGGMRPATRP